MTALGSPTRRRPAPSRLGASPVLDVHGLVVRLGGVDVVRGAALRVDAGQLVAVVGPNGAGKSTLLRAAAGLIRPKQGAVTWNGSPASQLGTRELARLRAFVPQEPRLPDGLTVTDAVMAGRAPHLGLLARPGRRDHDAVSTAMRRAGVDGFATRAVSTLSGGERRRVLIALALAQQAPAILADEPTAHLDLGAALEIAWLLRSLADEGCAIACVLHDLDLACAIADQIIVLHRGEVAAAGAPGEVIDPGLMRAVWEVEAHITIHHGRPRLVALGPRRPEKP